MNPRKLRRSGMTLLKVVIILVIAAMVFAVIAAGIGATFFMIAFAGIQKNAHIDSAKSQILQLGTAVEMYKLDVGRFPSRSHGLEALTNVPADVPSRNWRGPYIEQISLDPWGNRYNYQETQSSKGYEITSNGPDGSPGTADDVRLPQ